MLLDANNGVENGSFNAGKLKSGLDASFLFKTSVTRKADSQEAPYSNGIVSVVSLYQG